MANPKSRIEGELDGTAYTNKSRIEEYIAYIKGDSQTKPDKPRSRIEEQLDEISPGGGGGGTLVEKTITANDVYFATDDDADGYSKVTVNVPQPVTTTNVSAADLTGYEAGDTDLGNEWRIALGSGTAAVDSVTVGGVTYDGLAISGATTISSARTLAGDFRELEIEFIITALGSGDVRVISTGGLYYESTIWHSNSDDYLKIVLTGGTIIDTDNVIDQGNGDGHDLSLPKTGLVNTPLRVKYVSDGVHTTLYINDVPKAYWSTVFINNLFQSSGIHIGANGAASSNILVSKAEYSSERLSWDGHTYIRND